MHTVRNTVDTGMTVVCTIHQPSIDIFKSFDELLFLKRGGWVTYAGSLGRNSHELINYFETIEGVPKITPESNPATWMLEASSATSKNQLGVDFTEVYQESSFYQRNKVLMEQLNKTVPRSDDLHFKTKFLQSFSFNSKPVSGSKTSLIGKIRSTMLFVSSSLPSVLYSSQALGSKLGELEYDVQSTLQTNASFHGGKPFLEVLPLISSKGKGVLQIEIENFVQVNHKMIFNQLKAE